MSWRLIIRFVIKSVIRSVVNISSVELPFIMIVLLLLLVVCWDAPVVQLLEEVLLRFFVRELWENSSLVSQVVYKCLECLTVSVQEDFFVNLLQFMHV